MHNMFMQAVVFILCMYVCMYVFFVCMLFILLFYSKLTLFQTRSPLKESEKYPVMGTIRKKTDNTRRQYDRRTEELRNHDFISNKKL